MLVYKSIVFITCFSMYNFSQNKNFIDKRFTIIAKIVLQIFPVKDRAKIAFISYQDGFEVQSDGNHAKALKSYFTALCFETDAFDRSYILYNIRLIHIRNSRKSRSLEYYFAFLDRNPILIQSLNNVAVVYHFRGEQALKEYRINIAKLLFSRTILYWNAAIRLIPTNYIEVHNWIHKITSKL